MGALSLARAHTRARPHQALEQQRRAQQRRDRQRKMRNHANKCALCGLPFSVLLKPVQCSVCKLLYHEPSARTVVSAAHTCFLQHKRIEAEELAEQMSVEAEEEREQVHDCMLVCGCGYVGGGGIGS